MALPIEAGAVRCASSTTWWPERSPLARSTGFLAVSASDAERQVGPCMLAAARTEIRRAKSGVPRSRRSVMPELRVWRRSLCGTSPLATGHALLQAEDDESPLAAIHAQRAHRGLLQTGRG